MHDPVGLAARLCGITAPADLAAAKPVHHHTVASRKAVAAAGRDGACKINPGHMRIGANQTAKAVQAQPVLEIDVRIFDRDIDVAIIGKARCVNFLDAGGDRFVLGLIDN